jgi:hypothetical protein
MYTKHSVHDDRAHPIECYGTMSTVDEVLVSSHLDALKIYSSWPNSSVVSCLAIPNYYCVELISCPEVFPLVWYSHLLRKMFN